MSDAPTPRTDSAEMTGKWYTLRDLSRQLERELAEAKAKSDRAEIALLEITAGHFYQSSCRGGEMERLMNQAIESLRQ